MTKENQQNSDDTSDSDAAKIAYSKGRLLDAGPETLLGFQFVMFTTQILAHMPSDITMAQLISTGLTGISTAFIKSPVMYSEITEQGEDSPAVKKYAHKAYRSAMGFYSLGLSTEFGIITYTATQNLPLASAAGLVSLAGTGAAWFGYPLWKKRRNR